MKHISKRVIWSQAIQLELGAFANEAFQIICKSSAGTERYLGIYKEEAVRIGKAVVRPGRILPLATKGSIGKEDFIGWQDLPCRFCNKSVQENEREHE
jgi:hypothetical protein